MVTSNQLANSKNSQKRNISAEKRFLYGKLGQYQKIRESRPKSSIFPYFCRGNTYMSLRDSLFKLWLTLGINNHLKIHSLRSFYRLHVFIDFYCFEI